MIDTSLPPGLVVQVHQIADAQGIPFDWFRVYSADRKTVLGSGFTRDEAVWNAREELERRAS